MKRAVITGITGQDGAYLSRLLLDNGYTVFGTFRRTSSANFWRLKSLGVINHENFNLIEHDVTDMGATIRMLEDVAPDEVYNLAAQSFVAVSFSQPIATMEATGIGVVNILEGIRIVNRSIKFYQASTSEMFGKVKRIPQNEDTPFHPRSPYGVAKAYAHWMTVNYRESYGMFCCCGVLFNHESPLRGMEFVTRKITYGVAGIKSGKVDFIELGNLDAMRDWGFAGDYVKGMNMIMQADKPDDYVLATGVTKTVRSFVEMSFMAAGMNIYWSGEGVDEIGVDRDTGRTVIKVNKDFYRPADVDVLVGDAGKAKRQLGWKPEVSLDLLCKMMVDEDIKRMVR